ncbi:hypothetical protein VTK56DRAFT_9446 [Thermocarpiscus australiensis]
MAVSGTAIGVLFESIESDVKLSQISHLAFEIWDRPPLLDPCRSVGPQPSNPHRITVAYFNNSISVCQPFPFKRREAGLYCRTSEYFWSWRLIATTGPKKLTSRHSHHAETGKLHILDPAMMVARVQVRESITWYFTDA